MAKKSVKIKKNSWFTAKKALIFGFGFALIGSIIFYAFAATTSVTYSGALSSKSPVATYSITTGNGTVTATLTDRSKDLFVTIKNSAGASIGVIGNSGQRAVNLTVPVSPGTYTVTVSYPGTLTRKTKKNFNLTINYPLNDTTLPTAVLTSPASGDALTGVVNFAATASDDTGVTKVEFYMDQTLLTTDTVSPYSTTWDTTKVADGVHVLTVKSYDAANNSASASETVVVENTPVEPPAGTSAINLTASPASVSPSGLVTVTVTVDAGTITTDLAKAEIIYDATKLTYVGMNFDGSPFNADTPDTKVTTGLIDIVRYTSTPPGPSGSFKLATLTFTALASKTSTTISVNQANSYVGNHNDSTGANVLSSVSNATILFQ